MSCWQWLSENPGCSIWISRFPSKVNGVTKMWTARKQQTARRKRLRPDRWAKTEKFYMTRNVTIRHSIRGVHSPKPMKHLPPISVHLSEFFPHWPFLKEILIDPPIFLMTSFSVVDSKMIDLSPQKNLCLFSDDLFSHTFILGISNFPGKK